MLLVLLLQYRMLLAITLLCVSPVAVLLCLLLIPLICVWNPPAANGPSWMTSSLFTITAGGATAPVLDMCSNDELGHCIVVQPLLVSYEWTPSQIVLSCHLWCCSLLILLVLLDRCCVWCVDDSLSGLCSESLVSSSSCDALDAYRRLHGISKLGFWDWKHVFPCWLKSQQFTASCFNIIRC